MSTVNVILFVLGMVGTFLVGLWTSFDWVETVTYCQYVSFLTLPFRLLIIGNVIWKRCFHTPDPQKLKTDS